MRKNLDVHPVIHVLAACLAVVVSVRLFIWLRPTDSALEARVGGDRSSQLFGLAERLAQVVLAYRVQLLAMLDAFLAGLATFAIVVLLSAVVREFLRGRPYQDILYVHPVNVLVAIAAGAGVFWHVFIWSSPTDSLAEMGQALGIALPEVLEESANDTGYSRLGDAALVYADALARAVMLALLIGITTFAVTLLLGAVVRRVGSRGPHQPLTDDHPAG